MSRILLSRNQIGKEIDIATTLTARDYKGLCNQMMNGVVIKNNNKKGYEVAEPGDSIVLSYPTSTTRRGRVGKQISQTIQCTGDIGVVYEEI